MTDYSKATNFAAKDSLASGNPLKVVKGTEIDDEFEAIETAIGTKADLASPTLTGTPNAPTASTGTDSTQLATTAFVQQEITANAVTATDVIDFAYPVGSIYTSVVSTNPATLLGTGTWEAFGAGKVLVGIDSGDTDFDTVEETGGAKTHTLTVDEMPAHSHESPFLSTFTQEFGGGNDGPLPDSDFSETNLNTSTTGGGAAHNNLQPYIVVYMWKRTA